MGPEPNPLNPTRLLPANPTLHFSKFKFKTPPLSLALQWRPFPPQTPSSLHRLKLHRTNLTLGNTHTPIQPPETTCRRLPQSPTPSPGSRPTIACKQPRWPSARSSRSPKSSPSAANRTARAPSWKPSWGFDSMSARSRWALVDLSFSRWSTTPPLSSPDAVSRFCFLQFMVSP